MNWMKMLGIYRPMSARFEDDPAKGDPNDPNATGGDDDAKKNAGGGDDPKPKEDKFELTVDGEKRLVTLEEMKTLAQKSAGAEKKFADASELRKSAEDGLRLQELMTRMQDKDHKPSQAEIRQLAGFIGVDPGEFMEYLNSDDDASGKKPEATAGEISDTAFEKAFVKKFGMQPEELKSVVEYSHKNHVDQAREKIRQNIAEMVDKDEIFGKMNSGDKGKDRISTINDLVAEDVFRRIFDGEAFGNDLVAASIQKVRAHLMKLGIPGKPAEYPVNLGLGPGSSLPAEVQSETPIKRISAAEDDAEENFIARAMQKGLSMLRSKQS